VPPIGPIAPELLVDVLLLEDVVELLLELELVVPPPHALGLGGAWQDVVSTLHHQPP
jgi:hypothetical protein